jgi:hypothetical protein
MPSDLIIHEMTASRYSFGVRRPMYGKQFCGSRISIKMSYRKSGPKILLLMEEGRIAVR